MAEPVYEHHARAAEKRTEKRTEKPWAMVVLVLVAAAFVAGCRTGRGWGRLVGY
jgi:predicted small secreted protein